MTACDAKIVDFFGKIEDRVDFDAEVDYGVELLFFFQAEDGIRDLTVTGVQTCALPISPGLRPGRSSAAVGPGRMALSGRMLMRYSREAATGAIDQVAPAARMRRPLASDRESVV